jgi:hypothetical protein
MQSLYERQVEAIMGGLGIAPSGKLTVMRGDTVRVTVSFSYRGTALSFSLRCAIGNKGVTFDEIAYATTAISVPASANFVPYTAYVDISTAAIAPQANLDLYAKLTGLPGADLFTPYYLDVIDVLGAPEFQNFVITDYSKV